MDVKIIADVGISHDGVFDQLMKTTREASRVADVVKFQYHSESEEMEFGHKHWDLIGRVFIPLDELRSAMKEVKAFGKEVACTAFSPNLLTEMMAQNGDLIDYIKVFYNRRAVTATLAV